MHRRRCLIHQLSSHCVNLTFILSVDILLGSGADQCTRVALSAAKLMRARARSPAVRGQLEPGSRLSPMIISIMMGMGERKDALQRRAPLEDWLGCRAFAF